MKKKIVILAAGMFFLSQQKLRFGTLRNNSSDSGENCGKGMDCGTSSNSPLMGFHLFGTSYTTAQWCYTLPQWCSNSAQWCYTLPQWCSNSTQWCSALSQWCSNSMQWCYTLPQWCSNSPQWCSTLPQWCGGASFFNFKSKINNLKP